MAKESFTVKDQAGLHARPASIICNIASKHPDEVNIIYKDKVATLKSIMIIMSLAIPYNATFEVEVKGDNAEKTLQDIKNTLIEHAVI